MNISEIKLKALLQEMRKQFDFDVDIVAETVIETARVRGIMTPEELRELIYAMIDNKYNEKAMDTVNIEKFDNDPHQQMGYLAVGVGRTNKETIREAFAYLEKDKLLKEEIDKAYGRNIQMSYT